MTNYSGPRVGFPCPTAIHMKDTLTDTQNTARTAASSRMLVILDMSMIYCSV